MRKRIRAKIHELAGRFVEQNAHYYPEAREGEAYGVRYEVGGVLGRGRTKPLTFLPEDGILVV